MDFRVDHDPPGRVNCYEWKYNTLLFTIQYHVVNIWTRSQARVKLVNVSRLNVSRFCSKDVFDFACEERLRNSVNYQHRIYTVHVF